MIRVDEIYNNTFWTWFKQHLPGTRLFFCDPPGSITPINLFNYGRDDLIENDYIFFFDQEPIHLDIHSNLFDFVWNKNIDIIGMLKRKNNIVARPMQDEATYVREYNRDYHNYLQCVNGETTETHADSLRPGMVTIKEVMDQTPPEEANITIGHIVVNEKNSEYVDKLLKIYKWKCHYYFYHGWAALDWYRGYNKTFLIDRAKNRMPSKTFISPNRIIAGKRDHRVLFLYLIFKNNLEDNYITAPKICPGENIDINKIAKKYTTYYPDIIDVIDNANLPILFKNEETQLMTSCWITNFNESADSLFYVPTETVYFGRRWHLTEKTFKPIALEMPFILVATAGSLKYLRGYGFKTFNGIIDESYDEETDDILRLEKITHLLKEIDNLSAEERLRIHRRCLPIVEHNYNHFYGGNFEKILWEELTGMIDTWK